MSLGIGVGTLGCDILGGLIAIVPAVVDPPPDPEPTGLGIRLVINGVDRTGLLNLQTVSIEEELNGRNSCSFTLRERESLTFHPQVGEQVYVYLDDVLIFGGLADTIEERVPDGTLFNEISVECVDWNVLADRHVVAQIYENITFKNLVTAILTTDSGDKVNLPGGVVFDETLAGDGVTMGTNTVANPSASYAFRKVKFNYNTVADCFDDIADLTGFWWNIDYNRVLYFLERTSFAAPYPLDAAQWAEFGNTKVSRTGENYRNVQYLRAGTDTVGTPRTRSYGGDGKTTVFDLELPVAEGTVPTVTKQPGSVAQTVGISEKDEGKQWYYRPGETQISQDNAGTALSDTESIDVSWTGTFPILEMGRRDQEIENRRAIESTRGIWCHVEEDEKVDDELLAQEKVSRFLEKYGHVDNVVEYETDRSGFKPGQLQQVNLPEYEVSGDFLIDRTSFAWRGYDPADGTKMVWSWRVQAVQGDFQGGWASYFRRNSRKGRPFVIQEDEKIHFLRKMSDALGISDTLDLGQPLGSFLTDTWSFDIVGSQIGVNRERLEGDLDPPWAAGPLVGTPQHVGVS